MPSGNRGRRGKRERARDDRGSAPNRSKAAQPSGDKRTPTTMDNETTSKQVFKKSLKSCTPNANVHYANEEEEMAAAICWICAEPIKYYSLSSCNHRTCHVCALRLRALYEKVDCTFCKEPQSTVIFTTSADADFTSYALNAIPHKNAKLAIFFETEDIMEETLTLLRLNCPGVGCDYAASGWGDLKLHARAVHGKVFCDLCIRFKKVFPHEHALYLPNVLPLHLPSIPHRSGQQPPNETIECGIHPLCAFCNECFFGDDELFVHMREQHEECFLCKLNEIRYQYFQNYNSLEQHFSQAHFVCTDSACQAQKFVVFDSELDLSAHRLEVHGADMSPKDRKEARRVQFEPHDAGSGNWRAAQASADRGRLREPMPPIVQTQGSFSGMLRGGVEGMSEGMRATWRSAPSNRLASAKASIPESLTSESSAHELISTVWNVLDQNSQDTTKIINAVIDFLGEEDKKYDLLTAWNEYEIEWEQRHQLYDVDPTGTTSRYADITNVCVPSTARATAALYSPQSPRADWPDLNVVQPGSPSSPSSPSVSSPTATTFASSGTSQPEAFPSLVRPRTNSKVTPQSHQSHNSKSWASVAALLHSPPSPTTSKKTDAPRQPSALSTINGCPHPPAAGSSFDNDVTSAYYHPHSSQSHYTWASLACADLSAWTPTASWNREGGGSAIPEATMGEGRKGKGKQKQRLVSGSFSF